MTKSLALLLLTALMLPLSFAAERETRVHEKNGRHPGPRPTQCHYRTPQKAARCNHHHARLGGANNP